MEGALTNEPEVVKKLKGHKKGITAIDYNPNEQQIASGSLDNSVLLWDISGNVRSYRFQGHTEAVMDVTFSSNGKYMASASRDKTVRVWVPTVTGSVGMFKAHSQTVRSVQFTPDNCKILTASDDKIIKLWSSDKHKFISSFVGHTNWVRSAKISNDGSVIASCSDDKTARLWSLDSGDKLHVYKDQKGYGVHLAWHPSGCYIAVGTSYGSVKLYDIRTHSLVQYYSIHSDAITQLAFHPSGSYILTGSVDGKMKILDLLEGHPIFTLDVHKGSTSAVGFSPSGESFCSAGGEDNFVYVWKTNFTELHQAPEGGNENIPHNEPATVPRTHSGKTPVSATSSKARSTWKQCYHSIKYPISTYYHLDGIEEAAESNVSSEFAQQPNANSTAVNLSLTSSQMPRRSFIDQSISQQVSQQISRSIDEESFVGHISHIPRVPPTPTTYRLPDLATKSTCMEVTKIEESNSFYGMISLKENDVCYTSGTIEWVGKKRSFPLNSGFKIINDKDDICAKRAKFNKSGIDSFDKPKDCDCADVLPTVNAIVAHLNALHEAVDLVELRLSNLEGVVKK